MSASKSRSQLHREGKGPVPYLSEHVSLNITLNPDPSFEFQTCYKDYS